MVLSGIWMAEFSLPLGAEDEAETYEINIAKKHEPEEIWAVFETDLV